MKKNDVKKRGLNRPFVKGFLGGIVTVVACKLTTPVPEPFEPTGDGSILELFLYVGIPMGGLFIVGWLANVALSKFGFEGFKISEDWHASKVVGFFAGMFVYVVVAAIVTVLIKILLGTI